MAFCYEFWSNGHLTMEQVFFHSADISFSFPGKKVLKAFIPGIFRKEKKALQSIHYIFCSDNYLLKINQSYLSHDFFTDIISFDLSEKWQPVEGEVYISIERVRENARVLGIPFKEELLRVLFHGALHLCGYKDKTKAQRELMRKMENHYILKFQNAGST